MKILQVQQGTPEWKAERAKYRAASNAPVMMGVSSKMSRSELLRIMATGDEREFSTWVQKNLLDKGRDIEASARLMAEKIIGEELFPIVGTDDEGYMMASFDGATMVGNVIWECKLWNEQKAASVRAGTVPDDDVWQVQQQLAVSGAEKCLYMITDGTDDRTVDMWITPDALANARLRDSWRQFDEDLKNYQHVEVLPPPVAEPVMALPALSIQVNGAISLMSNLDIFGAKLKAFIEDIDKNPSDDQAFANAEAAVKTLKAAQDALEAAEQSALGQTASIDEMRRTVAMYKELARTTRLTLEKLVEARKQTIREEIRRGGVDAFAEHVAMLNTRLGKAWMPPIVNDFAGVMRGKKTIASLRDAVNTELARAKIEANAVADRMEINIKQLAQNADYSFLFADAAQIVLKEPDDFALLISSRIVAHKAAEQARLDAERARIRQEEAAKVAVAAPPLPAPAPTPTATAIPPAKRRAPPTDAEIIGVLAAHYHVTADKVVEWLSSMNLKAKGKAKRAA